MSKEKKPARVFHFDLQGKREFKYDFLSENSLTSISWNELQPNEPNFFLVKKDFDQSGLYEKGFKVDELFKIFASGLTTERDSLTIHFDEASLKLILNDFENEEPDVIRKKYNEKIDGRDWKISTAKQDVIRKIGIICDVNYRPFDLRKTYFTGKSKGFMAYPRSEVMQHLLKGDNVALVAKRGFDEEYSSVTFITKYISDRRFWTRPGMQGAENIFPLYLYPESTTQQTIHETSKRTPNLNTAIVKQLADKLGLTFTNEKDTSTSLSVTANNSPNVSLSGVEDSFAPIDILDYIYAVLHSPAYREKYKEFLKIDFPRVPYPKDKDTFWQLVKLGEEIRQIHLLESPAVEKYITQYPIDGNNVVSKIRFDSAQRNDDKGNVYINETQYFANVPLTAWSFFIGGYQPAQKWLKDRKERTLEFDDILHYQKIIVALKETNRLMIEIDKIIEI